MGQTDSKDNSKLQQLFSQYSTIQTFLEHDKFGECRLLQSKKIATQRVLLKEINLTDEFQFSKTHRRYETRSKLRHPNIINVTNQFFILEQQLCGQFYKIYVVFEYLQNTLADYIDQELKEPELWSLLSGTIQGLSFLQQNQINHDCLCAENIFINADEMTVKVADPTYFTQINMFTQILQDASKSRHNYLSPSLLESIQQNNWQPKHNHFKSDVFSLGMIVLHAALNSPCDDCYNYVDGIFYENVLQQKMQLFKANYSDQLYEYLKQMLHIQEEQRPDFIQLTLTISTQSQSSHNISNQQSQKSQYQISQQNQQQTQSQQSQQQSYQQQSQQSNLQQGQIQGQQQQGQQQQGQQQQGQQLAKQQSQPQIQIQQQIQQQGQQQIQQQNQQQNQQQVQQQSQQQYNISIQQNQQQSQLSSQQQSQQQSQLSQQSFQTQQNEQIIDQISYPPSSLETYYQNQYSQKTQQQTNNLQQASGFQQAISYVQPSNYQQPSHYQQTPSNQKQTTNQLQTANYQQLSNQYSIPHQYQDYKIIPSVVQLTNPNLTQDNLQQFNQVVEDTKSYLEKQKVRQASVVDQSRQTNFHITTQGFGSIQQNVSSTKNTNQQLQQGQSYLQNDAQDTIMGQQNLDVPAKPTQPDENADPSDDKQQGNALQMSKAQEFQPLQDYTNMLLRSTNGQQFQSKTGFSLQKDQFVQQQGYKLHLNHTVQYPVQEMRVQNSYAYNEFSNNKRDGFSLPFDLPHNTNAFNVRCTDYDVSTQNEDRMYNQATQNNELWKINHLAQNERQFQNFQPAQLSAQYERQHNAQILPYSQQKQVVEFVVEHYQNGSRYEGEKYDGMRHGQGRFYYQDGGLYDGGWNLNKMHGRGVLCYSSGQPAYDGEWIEDKFQGFGTLYNESPLQLQQEFDFRDLDHVEEFWIKYQGEFQDDNKEGQGTLFLSNGERFVGSFSKDYINGPGVFYCLNGRLINARWCNNKLIQ